jgi:DNA-binding winged helix-turn-helix (wHTH) protein/tetratricopeptide (TPR) repeat protein
MLTFDHFELDERLYELRAAGKPVPVQPKVFDLLVYLVRRGDRAVTKTELLEALWPEVDVGETALTHAVLSARKALGDDGVHQRFIATVRGRGYRFVARVDERVDSSAPPADPSHAALFAGSQGHVAPMPQLDEPSEPIGLAGPMGGFACMVDHLMRAAWDTADAASLDQAVRSCERALEAATAAGADGGTRCELLLGLGEASSKTQDHARTRRAFREAAALAQALGDGERVAKATLAYALGHEVEGVDTDRVAMLERAVAFHPPCPPALRAMLLARLGEALYFADDPTRPFSGDHARRFSYDRARHGALAREAVALAREVGEPMPLLLALRSLHLACWSRDSRAERLALGEEMLRVAEGTRAPEHLALALTARIYDLLALGDVHKLDRAIARFDQVTAELRDPFQSFQATVFRTTRALLAGRLDAAEASLREALAFDRSESVAQFWLSAQDYLLRREQGRLTEIEPALRALAERFPNFALSRCGHAAAACELGHVDAARATLEHFVGDELRFLRDDDHRPVLLAVLAQACAVVGDVARAELLYEALLPFDGTAITLGHGIAYYAPASQLLGMLAAVRGDLDRAVEHVEQAVATTARMEARALLVRARLELARVLVKRGERGDERRASGLRNDAERAAAELGMRLAQRQT